MAYSGFTPLCAGAPRARAAPAAGPAPPAARAIAPSAPRTESNGRSSIPELRHTYVDADEVAMMRAIARIDCDDRARRVGNQYSQTNRSRVQAELEAKAAVGLVPQDPHAQHLARKAKEANYTSISERGVRVPRVGVRAAPSRPPPVAFLPHRKTRDEIAAENDGFERPKAPPGKPVRSNDERKDELAMRNQFYGRTAEEVLMGKGGEQAVPKRKARAMQAPKTDEAELRDRIADEIAERQSWLDEMRSLGKAEAYEAQIKLQIAERLKDLERLDQLAR